VLILEVGAGAGNTAFPILEQNKNPDLKIHACDFSKKAVELIRNNPLFESSGMIGSIDASVWDVASPTDVESGKSQLPPGIEPETVDVVILIFIFSALEPKQWQQAIRNIWAALKPGGVVLFRDYGRGDLAQVRFKKGRYLDENFYVRGDGTRVYFFDEDELRRLWSSDEAMTPECKVGLKQDCVEQLSNGFSSLQLDTQLNPHLNESTGGPNFDILNFGVDRRMLVNRQRRLKMYRCWMQGFFRKPLLMSSTEASKIATEKTPAKSVVELLEASTLTIHKPIVEESCAAVSP
jgi:tRNAThr (cytosine32-N3)-methyltransferase